jgi:hypothetical protein
MVTAFRLPAYQRGGGHMTEPTGTITKALQESEIARDPETFHWHLWRVGRKVGRTIYVQFGIEPSDDDVLIGVMDTPWLAAEAINAHNAVLAKVQR